MDCGLRTTDYGLRTGYKTRTRYKTRTKNYGLGIKYGLGYKTRTEHYGLSIKHEERSTLNKFSHERFHIKMEAAHFPKEPAHTGLLTILDRLPKKKKNTLKGHTIDELYEFSNDSSRD